MRDSASANERDDELESRTSQPHLALCFPLDHVCQLPNPFPSTRQLYSHISSPAHAQQGTFWTLTSCSDCPSLAFSRPRLAEESPSTTAGSTHTIARDGYAGTLIEQLRRYEQGIYEGWMRSVLVSSPARQHPFKSSLLSSSWTTCNHPSPSHSQPRTGQWRRGGSNGGAAVYFFSLRGAGTGRV